MRIEISGRLLTFPHACACCGAAPDNDVPVSSTKSWGKRVIHTESRVWEVPYCARCITHIRRSESASSFARISTVASLLIAVAAGYAAGLLAGIIVGATGIVGTIVVFGRLLSRAESGSNPSCTGLREAVAYIGWSGTVHQFEVTSPLFAKEFMAANQKKLVNLSHDALSLLAAGEPGPKTRLARAPRRYVR